MNWYIAVLKKYAEFTGRAGRAECWMFLAISTGISIALVIFDLLCGIADLQQPVPVGINTLYGLAVLVPTLAVIFRRLHDTGRIGWWFLLLFVPAVGPIVLTVFLAQDSEPGANQYGPNPKGLIPSRQPVDPSVPVSPQPGVMGAPNAAAVPPVRTADGSYPLSLRPVELGTAVRPPLNVGPAPSRAVSQDMNAAAALKVQGTAALSCPSCGAPSSGGAFCEGCGMAFLKADHCPKCGAPLGAKAKFCKGCGSRAE